MNKTLCAALSASLMVTSMGFSPALRAQAVQETRSMPGDPQFERDRRAERREGRRDDRRGEPRADGRYDPRQGQGQAQGPGWQSDRRDPRRDPRRDDRWQRAENRYDAGEYRRPRGYVPRQWRYGERLPPTYRSRAYVVSNYPQYGLQPPPYGYQYTRVGNDVLLTAIATGVIASVIIGLFN